MDYDFDSATIRGADEREWNHSVETFNKALHATLLKKGFKRTMTSTQSAMVNWTYKRESDGRELHVSEWHGRASAGYGTLKAFLSIYDTGRPGHAAAVQFELIGHKTREAYTAAHEAAKTAALAYVAAL